MSDYCGIIFFDALGNIVQDNIICDNVDHDIEQMQTNGNTGSNNECDKANNWNDEGTTGCTYPCDD